MNISPPTIQRLKEVLDYDPVTGYFIWKVRTSNRVKVGDRAGHNKEGYLIIGLDGFEYRAHGLAWLFMTGDWPSIGIDHRNRNRGDNSWGNLRLADQSVNMHNASIAKHNTSGMKGLAYDGSRNKWTVRKYFRGIKICNCRFHDREEAEFFLLLMNDAIAQEIEK